MSDKDELESMKKALQDIIQAANEAMGDSPMQARALMSFRWIKRLAKLGLGGEDD